MSLFKGNFDSGGKFTAQDDVRGLELIGLGTMPSYWAVETGDGVKWYFWVDDSDNLRMHTSAPTASTRSSAGSVVTGASNAGASKNLSNLASTTVCNESLVSDTDSTDDLGSSSIYWKNTYTDVLYLTSTSILTGGSSVCTFTGGVTLGADGTDTDLICYGETTGQYMMWDGNAYTNKGALILKDNVHLAFGMPSATTGDITMVFNGTTFEIDSAADNTVINIGATYQPDIIIHGNTATSDCGWDASADTFQICDDAIFSIGGTAVGTHDGVKMFYNATADSLDIDARNASHAITFGSNTVTDLAIHGNAYDIDWDASEDELIFKDNVEVIWGTGKDLQIESTGTVTNFTMSATTGGIVVQPYAAATVAAIHVDGATNDWDGADNVGMLHLSQDAALVNAGATLLYIGSSGTPAASTEGACMRIEESGSETTGAYCVQWSSTNNNVARIHTGAVGVTPLTLQGHTSATASVLKVDGDTNGWTGATGVGMVHIDNDIQLAHANASLLLIDNAANTTAQQSAMGYCMRVVDAGAVTSDASAAYATYVSSTANNAMYLTTEAKAKTSLVAVPAASATAAVVTIDGDTNGWVGATGVGMVHVQNDVALAHKAASLVYIDNTGAGVTSAAGSCLKIVDSGTAATDAYVAYIASTSNEALHVDTGKVLVDEEVEVGSLQFTNTAVAASLDGSGAGTVTDTTSFATVTATDADAIVILPTPTIGKVVWLANSTSGYELRSDTPASVAINGGTGDSVECAIANTDLLTRCVCSSATTWIVTNFAADGTESKADAAAL